MEETKINPNIASSASPAPNIPLRYSDITNNSYFDAHEETLLAKRPSQVVLTLPLFFLTSLFLILVSLSYVIFVSFFTVFSLFLTSIIFLAALFSALVLKVIIDWYFHLYVVTDKKILELSYHPFFSHKMSGVSLSQVRCTEIDTRTKGTIKEFLDIGDIILTFDRPTHTEEFVMHNIHNPRKTAMFISHKLDELHNNMQVQQNLNNKTWLRRKDGSEQYRFIEEQPQILN